MLKLLSVFLLLGLAPLMALGQEPLAPLTPTQVAKIKRIEGRLMAPCCYTQTIRDHDSQVAVEMRAEVTSLVASGKSEQEIIAYYRTKYGETILVVPDGWTGHLLTVLPLAAFLASLSLLFFYIRRSVSAGGVSVVRMMPSRSEAEQVAIQEKIRAEVGEIW